MQSEQFPSRSRVNDARLPLREKRARKQRLLGELASLDSSEERELAEERLAAEAEWLDP